MPDASRLLRIITAAAIVAAASTSTTVAQVADAIRIGAIHVSYIARNSKTGRSELAKIEDATRQKIAAIEIKAAELQRQQAELQRTSIGLSPRAVADLQRTFDKSRRDFERLREDSQNEVNAMQARFELDFRARLAPMIDEISREKGLHFVFGLEEAAIVWWNPAIDISDEVLKRLDAEKK
jgi:Skp family chaperone for outer membrane proteins